MSSSVTPFVYRRVISSPSYQEPRGRDLNPVPPDVPPDAVMRTSSQINWDNGQRLVVHWAAVDRPEPHDQRDRDRVAAAWDDMQRAATAAIEASVRLAAIGVAKVERCIWVSEGNGGENNLILDKIDTIISDVAAEHAISRPADGVDGGRQWMADAWRTLAERDATMPERIEDPYFAFGPDGPPLIPKTWRGRSFRELPSPYEPLALAEQLQLPVVALTKGLAVLRF